MRFAVYHPWIYLRSGLERTFLEVMARSRHEWTWYTNHYQPQATFPELADQRVVEIAPAAPAPASVARSVLSAAAVARTKIPFDGYDGALYSLNGVSDLALVRARRPAVAYCHTPVKAVHDPHARELMRQQKPAKRLVVSVAAPAFGALDRRLWQRLDRVVANSGETRRRIVTAGLYPQTGVDVVRAGVDVDRYRVGPAQRPAQLLAVGRISWYKNFELAIDTVRLLAQRSLPADLTIAGDLAAAEHGYLDTLRARAAGLPVRFVLSPTDDELAALYRDSDLLLFTAVNEDYGLVPLEAMACGTPVVAVDQGGPRETVVDGETGWLVPPDAEAFAARVVEWRGTPDDARERTRSRARARAEEFGWDRFVERIDDIMESAVHNARNRP